MRNGCFSACQARNGSDSLSCKVKMPQTKWEIARVAYHDFHSRKHFIFGMPVRGDRNPSDICMPQGFPEGHVCTGRESIWDSWIRCCE